MTLVVDLLAAQYHRPAERVGTRSYRRLAVALEDHRPGLVDRWLLRDGIPVPGSLDALVSTGRVRAQDHRRRWPAGEGGVFVTGSLLDLRQPFGAVLPKEYDHPAWARVGVLDDLDPLCDPAAPRALAGAGCCRGPTWFARWTCCWWPVMPWPTRPSSSSASRRSGSSCSAPGPTPASIPTPGVTRSRSPRTTSTPPCPGCAPASCCARPAGSPGRTSTTWPGPSDCCRPSCVASTSWWWSAI